MTAGLCRFKLSAASLIACLSAKLSQHDEVGALEAIYCVEQDSTIGQVFLRSCVVRFAQSCPGSISVDLREERDDRRCGVRYSSQVT